MSRTVISGLVCITFLMLLEFSAVPQEPARKGADTESGQLTFNNACRTCHTTKEGDNRLGPNLHNVIGRKAGSLPSYGYSSAMKGADFVWDKEKLDRFIAKPDEVVPGNNMKSADSPRSSNTDDCYSAAINRCGRAARQTGHSFRSPRPFSSIACPPALCNPSLLHSTA